MNNMENFKPVIILLVEDNPADVRLMEETLKNDKFLHELHVVGDGQEAMDFLRGVGKHSDVPRPDLILLDLNMPRKDGRQVLVEIKSDPSLKHIPTVIMTTSSAEEDILQTYEHHANCYITKPINLDRFTDVVKQIEEFWFTMVKLPPRK